MNTAEEIFEKHWNSKTDYPLDDVIKHHMKYAIDAMDEYAKQEVIGALLFFRQDFAANALFNYKAILEGGSVANEEQLYELYLKLKKK